MLHSKFSIRLYKLWFYGAFTTFLVAKEPQTSNQLVLETKLCGYGKKSVDLATRVKCIDPNDVQNFGEDAGFFSKDVVIVADGVGGWARKGVVADIKLYAIKINSTNMRKWLVWQFLVNRSLIIEFRTFYKPSQGHLCRYPRSPQDCR